MCGIGGIIRILNPGDPDYPADPVDPLRTPSGGWLWHGIDPRECSYIQVDPGALPRERQMPPWLIPESWLDALDDGIKWRGPDGAGRFRDRVLRPDGTIVEVALVHRRLAIIDLQCGGQPMVVTKCPRCATRASPPGTPEHRDPSLAPLSAIVFNGCIYNHRELRAELEANGHVFESDHSDTEVILHGWGEWAYDVQQRLEGMYSLAIWDRYATDARMMRDRFGEKPLISLWDSNWVIWPFASTRSAIDSLASVTDLSRDYLLGDSIASWLVRGGTSGNGMPYYATQELSPADQMWVQPPRKRERTNTPPAADCGQSPPSRSFGHHDDTIEKLLVNSVRDRMAADVPIACLLSGGVDSSLIAWAAAENGTQVHCITVRMPNLKYDESEYASRVARHLGLPHSVIDCEDTNVVADLTKGIHVLGLPFTDSSLLPTIWACRAASTRAKVLLSGDGADEFFVGYDRFRAHHVIRHWRSVLRWLPTRMFDQTNPKGRRAQLVRLVEAARSNGWPSLERVFTHEQARALFPKAYVPDLPTRWNSESTLDDARNYDIERYLPADILRKVDTASMMCGVELRSPFLSPAITDFALSIPASIHMRSGETKHLLKQLARKYFPPEIIDRPKQGFAIPISDWWRTDFGGMQQLLLDSLAGDRPFGPVHDVLPINMPYVRQMLDEHWAAGGLTPLHTTRAVKKRDHGQRLFALVSLAIWSRTL